MEWRFETPGGGVTVCQEGERVLCRAIRTADDSGLYKAWLVGAGGGRALVGTLIPEGGALRLRRSLSLRQLQERGAWPPAEAEVVMAYPFRQRQEPAGWRWRECPGELLAEPRWAEGLERGLLRQAEGGFFLAFPYSEKAPFPMAELFCLGRLQMLESERYVVFRFSSQGRPEIMHDLEQTGDTTKEI